MKILYVVKNMRLSNGVASYSMNYFRKLTNMDIQIDFLVVNDIPSPYYDEISEKKCNIWCMPSYKKHPFEIIPFLKKIFVKEKYDIVHSHVINSGSLILAVAKKMKVPVRILHSHATQSGDYKWKEVRNFAFRTLSLYFANHYCACSKLAGDYLFKNRKYDVIPNAIDVNKYAYSLKKRQELRKEFTVEDKFLIGTVGRITKQKNPFFIVDIISKLNDMKIDFSFWWFGNGDLDQKVQQYAIEKKVDHRIIFWGANDKICDYYSAMDIFILPSLYEGLPIVGIEAQAAALPVLFADTITSEAKISESTAFLSIDNIDVWANEIIKYDQFNREKNVETLNLDDYKIENQVNKIIEVYNSCLVKNSNRGDV